MIDDRVTLGRALLPGAGDAVLEALDRTVIRIRLAEGIRVGADEAAGLYSLVNLAGRLFAHLELAIPDGHPVDLGIFGRGELAAILEQLRVRVSPPPAAEPTSSFELCWGCSPEGAGLSLDGAGWSWSLGPEYVPVPRAVAPPLGPLFVACLAVAQTMLRLLAPLGMAGHLTTGVTGNLLTYGSGPAPTEVESRDADLPPTSLLGAGSVGSSAVHAALLAGLKGGPLDLVDPDEWSERNRLRCPVLVELPSGSKAEWVADLARQGGLAARAHEKDVNAYVNAFAEPPAMDLVVVSVDNVEGRRDAVDVLARTTLNIGVSGLHIQIARHDFLGPNGCAYCQYVDTAPALSGAAEFAAMLRIPVERVVAILNGDGRISAADAALLSQRFPENPPNAGTRLEDLRRRLYAEAAVPVQGDNVGVSAPHVSAAAGVLALAEMIKHQDHRLHPFRLANRYDLDLSGEPPGHTRSTARDRSGRCLCYSPFRRRAWATLHDETDALEPNDRVA